MAAERLIGAFGHGDVCGTAQFEQARAHSTYRDVSAGRGDADQIGVGLASR